MCFAALQTEAKKIRGRRRGGRYTGNETEKRPGCFYSGTPLDGTMCPHKMSYEMTLEAPAQLPTMKVKVTRDYFLKMQLAA